MAMGAGSSFEQALLDDYLRHIATEKRLAERTQLLYLHDLQRLAEFAQAEGIAPSQAAHLGADAFGLACLV